MYIIIIAAMMTEEKGSQKVRSTTPTKFKEKKFNPNSDFIIKTRSCMFHIDRGILGGIGVLAAIVESSKKHEENFIHLDANSWIVNEVLKYLYSKRIEVKYLCKTNSRESTIQLLEFAHKWNIQEIEKRCENLLCGLYFTSDIDTFIIADQYKLAKLAKKYKDAVASDGIIDGIDKAKIPGWTKDLMKSMSDVIKNKIKQN